MHDDPRTDTERDTTAPTRADEAAERRLDRAWIDWLRSNLARGCDEADLCRIMAEHGFAAATVRAALDMVSIGGGAIAAMPAFQPDEHRVPDHNTLRLPDRTVRLALRMQAPNVAVIDGFLSAEECDALISMSRDRLSRSSVVSDAEQDAQLQIHPDRTSEGTWFRKGAHDLVTRIEARIEALTGIPAENGEGLQVLSYAPGAQYKAHHDYFSPRTSGGQAHLGAAGQRIATVVLYLNDVDDGGDTIFPSIELAVKPAAGRALYFEYFNAAGELDDRCLHAGAPVLEGRKWIATKWLRERRWG